MILFSDSILDAVRQLMDDESRACWGIGDIINYVAEQERHPVAVVARHLAYETGGNHHTFRDYAYVSGRIPDDWRVELPLTRHQWKACLSAGDDCFKVAMWALENADRNGGRPMSVAAIRAHIMGLDESEYNDDADQYAQRYIARTNNLLYAGAYDERAPEWLRELYREWIAELHTRSLSSAERARELSVSRM